MLITSIKRNLIPLILITLIAIFFLQPSIVQNGAIDGIILWYKKILPTLFPMFLLSNILLSYNFIYTIAEKLKNISFKLFKNKYAIIPYLVSIISGYPSGAFSTNLMVENKKITHNDAIYLLSFTNLCSFQFIMAVIAISMYKKPSIFFYIAIPHYLGGILVSILLQKKHNNNYKSEIYIKKTNISFSEIFTNAMRKSINSILTIAGVIVLFSIISEYIIIFAKHLGYSQVSELLIGLLIGSLEMTNGCNLISTSTLPIQIQIILINFILSFSGLSVILQTITVTKNIKFNVVSYFKVKLIHGIISALISLIMIIIMGL